MSIKDRLIVDQARKMRISPDALRKRQKLEQAERLAAATPPAQQKGNETMAKKKAAAATEGVNKSALIRAYKQEHPEAKPAEIAEALTKQTGTEFKPGLVSTTLYQAAKAAEKKGGAAPAKGKKAKASSATSSNGSGALEAAFAFAQQAGGLAQAQAALDKLKAIKEGL